MDRNWSISAAINQSAEKQRQLAASFTMPKPNLPPAPDPRFRHGPPSLCQLAAQPRTLVLSPDWVMEPKHDGVRLLWRGGVLLTREGEPAPFAEHLRPLFERFERRCGQRMFVDCEYVEAGGFHATLAAVRRGEGAGPAFVFDALPLSAWESEGGAKLAVRRHFAEAVFDGWSPDGLRLVEQWPAACRAVVEAKAAEIWAAGGEGLVLKNREARYTRSRNASWVKVKRKLRLAGTVTGGTPTVAIVEIAGSRHRIPSHRERRIGDQVAVEAMEWTEKGRLRQAKIVD